MAVPVMQIGVMRVLVHERHMAMPVRVRLAGRIAGHVRMLMVSVMRMAVLVLEGFVHVLVLMRLGEMQIESDRHQKTRNNELQRHGFAEPRDRDERADERRRREIGAGARGPEMAQSEHEQDEADAVADKADQGRAADRGRRRKLRTGNERRPRHP